MTQEGGETLLSFLRWQSNRKSNCNDLGPELRWIYNVPHMCEIVRAWDRWAGLGHTVLGFLLAPLTWVCDLVVVGSGTLSAWSVLCGHLSPLQILQSVMNIIGLNGQHGHIRSLFDIPNLVVVEVRAVTAYVTMYDCSRVWKLSVSFENAESSRLHAKS